MQQLYFLSLTTDNTLRVLQRIASIFARHRVNVEHMNVFESKCKGISHFSITIYSDNDRLDKIVKQLKRIVELHDVQVGHHMAMQVEGEQYYHRQVA